MNVVQDMSSLAQTLGLTQRSQPLRNENEAEHRAKHRKTRDQLQPPTVSRFRWIRFARYTHAVENVAFKHIDESVRVGSAEANVQVDKDEESCNSECEAAAGEKRPRGREDRLAGKSVRFDVCHVEWNPLRTLGDPVDTYSREEYPSE